MTVVLATLAAALIAVLAYIVRRQIRHQNFLDECLSEQAAEVAGLRDQLSAIAKVVDRSAGGLEKRIREHQQVVTAISNRQPGLFDDEPALQHWLNANAQFLNELKSAGYSERN